MESIKRAVELLGGLAVAAKAIGVSPQALNQWSNGVRPVPAERCPVIERLTRGAVRCEDLNPKVDWGYLRAAASSNEEAAA